MTPEAFNTLFSICIGFALAGALVNGYQALAQRPAGFGLLQDGVAPKTFAAVPFLVFAAPFIIMRNTLRERLVSVHERARERETNADREEGIESFRCHRNGPPLRNATAFL